MEQQHRKGSLELSANRHISRFLLVSLKVETILQEITLHRRRQKLNAITDSSELGGVYSEALGRIMGQDGGKPRLGMAALMWISHSERPLSVDELCHALGVEIGSADLDGDNVPSIRTLLTCCQGLVSMDEEASTVRLIHSTLHEYLRAHPQLFDRPHATMAETCLSYLNSHQVKDLFSPSGDLTGTPFLEYSSLYWGVHAKTDLSDCAKQLVLKLFEDYSNHISTQILLRGEKPEHLDLFPDELSLFSHLHCASFFGIVEIVTLLIEKGGCDVNQRDCIGSTPLVWAALNGHEGVVKVLLGQDDINPNTANGSGETSLWCAAENGHEAVVETLLGQDGIDPDRASGYGETPLCCAAKNGHEGVVEILLGRNDVNPDKPDRDGRTPLWCAAAAMQEGVVKILLGRDDINPNKPDKYGATPLWHAALIGHSGVVEILLGRNDVNPDKPDRGGRTPLLCAAETGHGEVVKILLGRNDVNPDKSDNCGKTPLLCARQNGHGGVVKILLERNDSSPGKPDNNGETLLLCADDGDEGATTIQPGRDAGHPDKPDKNGETLPLSAGDGDEVATAIQVQPGRDAGHTGRLGNNGETLPLCADGGGEGSATIQLGRNVGHPHKLRSDRRNPLRRAAKRALARMRALLRRPASATPGTT